MAILEPLGPSSELAWAYARLAGQRMVDGQDEAAIELARRAQALAESLRRARGAQRRAQHRGLRRRHAWAADWADLAAPGAGDRGRRGPAGTGGPGLREPPLHLHAVSGGSTEADRYFADGVAYCDEHDIGTYATCLRGERADALEKLGRWDESAALSEELLDA